MKRSAAIVLLGLMIVPLLAAAPKPRTVSDFARIVAPLIDPAKLQTLASRGANPRVCRVTYWLETARASGLRPEDVASRAVAEVGMRGDASVLTVGAMVRNRQISDQLGCLDEAGLLELRSGKSPTIRRGPYRGDQLSVDHVVPRAVCPELDNVIANLEFMPMRMNSGKRDTVGDRQVDLAGKFRKAGLLSESGYQRVARSSKR